MMVHFLWDDRPGRNVEHITAHGMTTTLWEAVYRRATGRIPDKNDATLTAAEGRVRGTVYRIIYAVDDDIVVPLSILPIAGFPIERRRLR